MSSSLSLRARLIIVILAPLMIIAALYGIWAYQDAQQTAAERFDRSLLSTALAISRDVAVSGGDALSQETRDLLRDTSGGSVFYHVYAPDGVFVTGYATPPVPPNAEQPEPTQTFYDAIYQGAAVRALRVVQTTSIDGLSGPFTFTVWQDTQVRDGFVRSRTQPVFLVIALMIGALGVVVWFGVAIGLAPLTDLEDAIARRSSDDLSPIKRRIPRETKGIVGRFNALLSELSQTIEQKDAFISDAAHQLRNPIAGVLTLADSVERAADLESARSRFWRLRARRVTLPTAFSNWSGCVRALAQLAKPLTHLLASIRLERNLQQKPRPQVSSSPQSLLGHLSKSTVTKPCCRRLSRTYSTMQTSMAERAFQRYVLELSLKEMHYVSKCWMTAKAFCHPTLKELLGVSARSVQARAPVSDFQLQRRSRRTSAENCLWAMRQVGSALV